MSQMLTISFEYFQPESDGVPEMMPLCTFNKGWGVGVGEERGTLPFGRVFLPK